MCWRGGEHSGALLTGVSNYLGWGSCVMSCQIIELWQLQLVGAVGDGGWLVGHADGQLVGWPAVSVESGPNNTNGVNKALWEGEPLTSVDMMAGSRRVTLFCVCPKGRVLRCPTGDCTTTLVVFCPAALFTAPRGPPPVRASWKAQLHCFGGILVSFTLILT